jgi:hypothetical protein
MQDVNNLQAYLRQFAKDREWDQFHSPTFLVKERSPWR